MIIDKNYKDIVIVGSGIGGLTTAIFLLKFGYNVTIVEKNNETGGLTRGYRRYGIECPVGAHYLGSLGENQPLRKIFDYLGISSKVPVERMGVNGPIDRYFFDNFSFDVPQGVDAYEESLRVSFPDDNDQITKIMGGIRTVADMMQSFDFPFSNNNDFSIAAYFKPLGEILTTLKCSSRLRSVLEVPCSWIGVPLDDCPAFYHHTVLLSYLFSSWRLKCSGAQMVNVFTERFEELGGNLILGDETEKIITENKEVQGALLKSGRTLKVKIVIAAIHPKIMLKMLQNDSVRSSYIKRINQIEDTAGAFSVHLGLDSFSHKELPYNIFKLATEPDGKVSDVIFYQLRKSEKPNMNLLSIVTSSSFEDWKKWEDTVSGKRGKDYLNKKKELAEELINTASDVLGSLNGMKMLDTYSPLTIRDWVNSPNGSAYGVMRSRRQIFKTASLNRTSVKGLFLSGQSVVAPGILGTALGSVTTVRSIAGHDVFNKEVLKII